MILRLCVLSLFIFLASCGTASQDSKKTSNEKEETKLPSTELKLAKGLGYIVLPPKMIRLTDTYVRNMPGNLPKGLDANDVRTWVPNLVTVYSNSQFFADTTDWKTLVHFVEEDFHYEVDKKLAGKLLGVVEREHLKSTANMSFERLQSKRFGYRKVNIVKGKYAVADKKKHQLSKTAYFVVSPYRTYSYDVFSTDTEIDFDDYVKLLQLDDKPGF